MHIIGTAGEVRETVAAVGGDRRDHADAQPASADEVRPIAEVLA